MIRTWIVIIYVYSVSATTCTGICTLGIASITNGMATVTIYGLECGVTYTTTAGGALNGSLIGPRSFHGTVAESCLVTTMG